MKKDFDLQKDPELLNLMTKLIERLCVDWSKFTQQDVEIKIKGVQITNYKSIADALKNNKVLTELEMDMGAKFATKYYMVSSHSNTVTISGLALNKDKNEIESKVEIPDLETDYQEKYRKFCELTTEACNVTFNSILQEESNSKFNNYFLSANDFNIEDSFSEGPNHLVFIINFSFTSVDLGNRNFSLLFPLELIESFYGKTIYFRNDFPNGKILVVDDSKSDITLIRNNLRSTDYMIIEAKNEQAAFHQILSHQINIILLDIYLKSENGLLVCRRIRRNMLCDTIPIIMYSWGATRENIVKSLRVGAQDFLAKPFNKELLKNKIQKCLKNKKDGVVNIS